MGYDQDSFYDAIDSLVAQYDKENFEKSDLKAAILDEAIELVQSLNSREVAAPEYKWGGDR